MTPYSVVTDGDFYRIEGVSVSRTDFTIEQLHSIVDMLNAAYRAGAYDKAEAIKKELLI